MEIHYETNTDYDFFYPIKCTNMLYLVINNAAGYCISFKFSNSNYISLKNDEEYFYPIVTSNQYIETTIANVSNSHFIFYYDQNTYQIADYKIYVNGIEYYIAPYTKIFSLIPKENDIKIKIVPAGQKFRAIFRYISVPYSNITSDTFYCFNHTKSIRSYFIKKSKQYYNYYLYSLSNNISEYYENKNRIYKLTDINKYFRPDHYDYFILLRDRGCFQVKYSDDPTYVLINYNDSIKILNSETYKFKFKCKDSRKMKLSIYSSENNFINKILIDNNLQNLEIKNDNISYYYTFLFTTRYVEAILAINFNLYYKEYINVYFGIEYDDDAPSSNQSENRSNYTALYVIVGIILAIIIAFAIYKIMPLIKRKYKEKKRDKQRLLIAKNQKELVNNFYELIMRDCTQLEKFCLICFNNGESTILNNNNKLFSGLNNSNINELSNYYIVHDINYEICRNFKDYITPYSCSHIYHKECYKKRPHLSKIFRLGERCPLCRLYITSKNLKNFGPFFTKKYFVDLLYYEIVMYQNLLEYNLSLSDKAFKDKIFEDGRKFFFKLRDKFYSVVENNPKINKTYRDNLIAIRKINEEYKTYYDQYYDINIDSDISKIKKELDNERIEKERERQREWERQRKNKIELSAKYYGDEDEDEDVYNEKEKKKKKSGGGNRCISGESQRVNLYFCKDCSRFYCIFCKKKQSGGNMTTWVHKKCGPKDPRKNCFICHKIFQHNYERSTTSRCCHNCSNKYDARKTCPICFSEFLN